MTAGTAGALSTPMEARHPFGRHLVTMIGRACVAVNRRSLTILEHVALVLIAANVLYIGWKLAWLAFGK